MKSRHLSRSLAVQTLYALDFNSKLSESLYPYNDFFPCRDESEVNNLETDIVLYSYYLINGVLQNLKEIDFLINKFSSRNIERISIVDRNILRISFFMLRYENKVSYAIIIDEAVKLSKEFSNEINFKFINGVLDTFCKGLNDTYKN